jgi:putative ABC transport system permease protein
VWGDSTFFTVFTVPLLEGDARTALTEPNTIAISRAMAAKYFPSGPVLNESLILDESQHYRVTAVYEDLPENSHFRFDMIRSITGLEEANNVSLVGGTELNLYLLLDEGSDPAELEAKFPAFVEKHVAPQLASALQNDFSLEKFYKEGNRWRYWLTPLTDIHLHSDLTGELEANGSITYVYLFSSIAIFILVIACINFMNLSTARSADRAREVGIRKVMGSLRMHLVRQFLTESFILTAISFVLALGLAYLFLPIFNDLAQKKLSLPLHEYSFYLALLAATLFVGVLAGLYPSFFLSGFKPVNVLKGKLTRGTGGGFIRSGLVVFQFVISIFLIIGTITIQRQLSYIQNKKIGFEKDQVLVIHNTHSLGEQIHAFKEEALRNSFISSGTISGFLPVSGTWRSNNTFWPEGKAPTAADVNEMISMQMWDVDYDYINTLGMKLIAGRNFSRDFPSDSAGSIILNEAAAERLEFNKEAVGRTVSYFNGTKPDGTPDPTQIQTLKVVGVVENFHFESMRENIEPLAFFLRPSDGYVSFRYSSADTESVINAISESWKKLAPDEPFVYSFLDEDFGKMYNAEKRLGTIFATFAGLAILIACLGLFAITSFTARQRTKEIGIRKTLGASFESIVLLLSKSYSKLILIAFVLSTPLAWFAVKWWLQSYTYKAQIGVVVYLLAGVVTFLVAMVTVSYQSIRAAKANPATTLRNE